MKSTGNAIRPIPPNIANKKYPKKERHSIMYIVVVILYPGAYTDSHICLTNTAAQLSQVMMKVKMNDQVSREQMVSSSSDS